MNAAVLTETGHIQHRRIPRPQPRSDELLVRVEASGICGSDLAAFRGTHPYKSAPAVLGHEFSGTIIDSGTAVTRFSHGDLVCSAAFAHCGRCGDCADGATNLCRNKLNLSHLDWTGSFAEYVMLRESMTYRLPEGLDPAAGALVEPLSIGRHAIALAQNRGSVAILGSGTIGLACSIAARQHDLGPVACVDLGSDKGSLATAAGAHHYIDASRSDPVAAVTAALAGAADVVVIASGYRGVFEHAAHIVRPGGEVIVVSYFAGATPVEVNAFVGKEATIRCSALSTAADFRAVIGWLEQGMDPTALITHRFALDEADRAFSLMHDDATQTGKIMLHIATGNPQSDGTKQ
ncbi:alcohol dehydrogenase catalytic domain-containing protein [Gordonia sp. ABSL11-1]|uniref:zinc-dependent alcohol dehydrogenase n=1 Tax=Gordonia sp. ABSL11-1 TaxID=3053924 RepID=UPI00257390E2|nr:alcohol dehydrogenase catalytic domain-containing protein [Gordonia sp. ABSL11-1]MDL9947219.1 alcohol dehydrogenase catalytic domain-containing protein [Gordonia sp. ABSL11-1]